MLAGVAADVLDSDRLEAELTDVEADRQMRAAVFPLDQDLTALKCEPQGRLGEGFRRDDQRNEQI